MDNTDPTQPQPTPEQSGSEPQRSSYWLIPLALVSPALLCMVAVWCKVGEEVISLAMCTSILAGFLSSYLTTRNSRLNVWLMVFVFLFLVPVYIVAALAISMLGCMVGQSTGGTPIRFGG